MMIGMGMPISHNNMPFIIPLLEGATCWLLNGGQNNIVPAPYRLRTRSMAMHPISRAALIVNSHARTGLQAFEDACAALNALGIEIDAHAVHDPAELHDVAVAAIEKRPDVLILGGGDGTISSLVDHLVGSGVPLGLLPLGTANSFARSLGLPLDLKEAIKIIAAGHIRTIDLGMIDHDYFANFAAMGMSPLIAETIPHRLKKWGGRPGYALWAAVQTFRFRPFRLTLSDDSGWSETLSALEVRIANGSFQGGTRLVEDAEVDSGEIVIQVVEGRTHGRLALSWLLTLLRLPHLDRATRKFHARSFRIETDPELPISIDGEVLARTPVTAKVAPHIIRVMAPASA
jgi:YegS/Rv2252/BmrU family lipid kinase